MKKVQAIANFRVNNLKDWRAFLGACNFFRRHVKSFTYSSAGLKDLLKKMHGLCGVKKKKLSLKRSSPNSCPLPHSVCLGRPERWLW